MAKKIKATKLTACEGGYGFLKYSRRILSKADVERIFGKKELRYHQEGNLVIKFKWDKTHENAELIVIRVP